MAKRGKSPSLIGGGAGVSRFVKAKRKRNCKRCEISIPNGGNCIEVAKPGGMGRRTYCTSCYDEILVQSRKDLDRLEASLQALK